MSAFGRRFFIVQGLQDFCEYRVHTFVKNQCMAKNYPLQFTLEDGTHVTVQKTGEHIYNFTLKDEGKPERQFTINDSEEFTDEKEKALDFDQLNALRRFWLETRNQE